LEALLVAYYVVGCCSPRLYTDVVTTGDLARGVVGAASAIGKRFERALRYSGRRSPQSCWGGLEAFDADTIQEDEAAAKMEAERSRPGLTMFTGGSRLDSGAAGYTVAWQNGQHWVGIKTHMGYNQEAYDVEYAALARALETAARRQTAPERVTIFTDAQAAIRCMASGDPGPGQMHAIQARKHIATLRRARLGIIKIRWCPAHKGVAVNEKADEWAKLAAEEPDANSVEWLQAGARPMPPPRSLDISICTTPQAGDLGEEVERGPPLGWRSPGSHHRHPHP
jgi:ribonuclease HI